jgi:peptide deformylase
MVLPIVEYPNDKLRSSASRVDAFDSFLQCISKDMVETMHSSGGVGLAAPQIGLLRQVIVVDPSGGTNPEEVRILVNPRITWKSSNVVEGDEGCLSIPDRVCRVTRHQSIEVEYQDTSGKSFIATFTDFLARIVQHEIDHLQGVLMTDDRSRPLKKSQQTPQERIANI